MRLHKLHKVCHDVLVTVFSSLDIVFEELAVNWSHIL